MSTHVTSGVAKQIDEFFSRDVRTFTNRLSEFEHQIVSSSRPQRDSVLERLTNVIHAANDACRNLEREIGGDRELLAGVQQQYRVQIAPWFQRSWFMQRALTKPRGYPGDYLTLAAIYDGKPKTSGMGGYLDLYFLNTTLGRAVVERLKMARRFLLDEIARRQGDVGILNVACGPCREYVGGMDIHGDCNVRITCIDYDSEALDFVTEKVIKVEENLPQMDCVRYNALRMSSSKANIRQFGKCDIIYSVGLCDYVADKRLIPMLQGMRETLNEGGVLYVAFKDTLNYDKVDYQWLVDWFFLPRTEEDCRELFRQAGYNADDIEMLRDSTDVIMNFACRVKRPTFVRMDTPTETTVEASHGEINMQPRRKDKSQPR